jgi:hypothetical protein
MRDIPIPLHAWEVLALLDGRKTQTRRLAWREKECPGGPINDGGGQMDYIEPSIVRTPSPWQRVQPGDRLWVRETWQLYGMEALPDRERPIFYRADDDAREGHATPPDLKWRSSIHMPRWASRLTLAITDVRVQLLHEISEADAQAEGTTPFGEYRPSYVAAFRSLWNHLHGFGAWDANPEVVALAFTVTKGNIDA